MSSSLQFSEDELLPDHLSLLAPHQRAALAAKRAAEQDGPDLLPAGQSLLTPSQRAELRARRGA